VSKQRVLVAILAGGRGTRLGGSKPSALLGGRPLVCRPLEAARTANLPVVMVAKPGTHLPALDAELIHEPSQPSHPLCGLLAALDRAASPPAFDAVLALACDMPFLDAGLLSRLARQTEPTVIGCGDLLQPLPLLCPLGLRETLAEALAGERSLRSTLAALEPRVLGERELTRHGDPERICFNVNDPEDLRRAERLLAAGIG
jgi:molybdopterin-guanine dinucleotide biosynthesis protein A